MPWKNSWFQIGLLVVVIAGGLLVWDSLPWAEMIMGSRAFNRNDNNQGKQWLEMAAARGNSRAEAEIGLSYQMGGLGYPQDYVEAMKWDQEAAAQGNMQGEDYLAELYEGGLGVQQNYAEAMNWWQKAAAQGDDLAELMVGRFYENGWGVPKDTAEARRWYQKAAAKGNVLSEYTIGYLYENGLGVPKDAATAIQWYQKTNGFYPAQQRLAALQGGRTPQ